MSDDKNDILARKLRHLLNYAHHHTTRTLQTSRRTLVSLEERANHTARLLRHRSADFLAHPALSAHLTDDYFRGAAHVLTAAVACTTIAYATYKGLARFRTADHIPRRFIRRGGVLHGFVISVRDGDGLRVRHVPFLRRLCSDYTMPRVRRITDHTINVRLAAVDAPESAQRFGKAAKNWLYKFAMGKKVSLRVHSIDRYQRVVATVHTKHHNPMLRALGLGKKNVSLELARAGYATLYQGSGAQYGGERMKTLYMAAEAVAKRKCLGMWADKRNYVSPMEFKRAMKSTELSKVFARLEGRADKSIVVRETVDARQGSHRSQSLLTALYRFAVFSYRFLKRYR